MINGHGHSAAHSLAYITNVHFLFNLVNETAFHVQVHSNSINASSSTKIECNKHWYTNHQMVNLMSFPPEFCVRKPTDHICTLEFIHSLLQHLRR